MGYRSNGVFALKREVYDRAVLLDVLGTFPSLLRELEPDICEDAVYWEYYDYKMYDGYPDVDEFTNWMEYFLENNFEGLPWLIGFQVPNGRTKELEDPYLDEMFDYIRLGESADDIEQLGQLGCLCIERSIERY